MNGGRAGWIGRWRWALTLTLVLARPLPEGANEAPGEAALPADWAFQPLRPIAIPALPAGSVAANPIDAFIRIRLAEHGLGPAPVADRPTLIRRLSFDLTGLPPSAEEVGAFVRDRRPDAWRRLVDRLLASPGYGERWARHWLDVVRFGESQGFEYDRIRDHAWRYRDYVIAALNADKPYDRFVREQLAGDVLEPITEEGIVATGFLVAGPWDQAGNSAASASVKAMVREAELEDLLGTVGQTFLGVTLNCARCHNHKFDPVPQRDYYRVKAVFQGVKHGERSVLTPAEERQRDEEKAANGARLAVVETQLAGMDRVARIRLEKTSEPEAREPSSFSRNRDEVSPGPLPWARWTFEGDARDVAGALQGELRGGARIEAGRLVLDGRGAYVLTAPLGRELAARTLEAWVTLGSTTQRGGGVLTVETPDGGRFDAITFAERQPGKWIAGSESYRRTRDLSAPEESAAPGELLCLAIVYGSDGGIAVFRNGKPYGEPWTPGGKSGELPSFAADSRVLLGCRHTGGDNAFFAGEIEEARLYDRALSAEEVAASYRAGTGAATATRDEILAAMTALEREEHGQREREREQLLTWRQDRPPAPLGYVANAEKPGPTFVLNRGEPDKPREQVTAAALSAMKSPAPELGLDADAPEAERRRRFADWVASADNSLTARVIVNRVWQHHFGRGLVGTPNDFGRMGERPSHPELLDWLAAWFVAPEGAGWSLKRLHRLIVESETYRQESGMRNAEFGMRNEEAGSVDVSHSALRTPHSEDVENRLLGRFTPWRLEAEGVRDAMLALSGELNTAMGGPGFRSFIHKGSGGQNEYFAADLPGPGFDRRTIYRLCVHSARDPLLDSLDCPEFSTRTPVRPSTTTPLQALSLMNNPFVQRMAAALAARMVREGGPVPAAQVTWLWWSVLGRAPSAEELRAALALSSEQGGPALSWALFNANEFVMVH